MKGKSELVLSIGADSRNFSLEQGAEEKDIVLFSDRGLTWGLDWGDFETFVCYAGSRDDVKSTARKVRRCVILDNPNLNNKIVKKAIQERKFDMCVILDDAKILEGIQVKLEPTYVWLSPGTKYSESLYESFAQPLSLKREDFEKILVKNSGKYCIGLNQAQLREGVELVDIFSGFVSTGSSSDNSFMF